jgi:hypothetical protein
VLGEFSNNQMNSMYKTIVSPNIARKKWIYTYTVNYGIKIQHLTEYKTNTKLTEKNIGIKIHGPPDTGGSCL